MTENDIEKIKDKIESLLASQKLGVLSTCGQNGPYANLISFVEQDDLKRIIFATPRGTQKFTNMKADSRVALLVENSQNKMEDFKEAVAVTVTGVANELSGEKRQRMINHYLEKHPNLKEFVYSGDSALMEIVVDAFVLVENFQTVKKLEMKQH